jgi:YVTN family beta-propeller protein
MTTQLIRIFILALIVNTAVAAYAQLPSPALLVLNKDDNTLAIIDPATNKVVGTAPTGNAPHEVAASSDGRFAYVANYGSDQPGNSLSVIDLAARKETRVDVTPLSRPHGIVFADGQVYFTAELSKAIARLDPQALKVDWLLGTGQNLTHMLVVAKSGTPIFTANIGSNTISMIEHASGRDPWIETVIPVGKGPEGCDLSPNGKEFWAANSGDGSVSIIDVAAKKAVQTIDVGTKHSNRLKFTPDGKLVLISDAGSGDVVVVDTSSRKVTKRENLGKVAEGILIVPDGSQAYIALSADDKVAIFDLKTLSKTGEIATGHDPDGMAWAGR